MRFDEKASFTTTFVTAAAVLTAVIGFTAWLWAVKWTQDQMVKDIAELRDDVRWIQRHIPATDRPADTAARK